ncbi:MAG: 4Fe-4S dicluster domain-containing protein [Bacteroidetes bacterium]|nr:4Fe-4S dicluster domain-containing protein [Bacteroidota bacterium]
MKNESENKKSRREFLIATTAITSGLVFAGLLKPFKTVAENKTTDTSSKADGVSNPLKMDTDHWYGFGFDIEKCIGCGSCVKACKIENDVPKEPFFFRTWVEQYAEKNDGTIKVESPNGGLDGQKQEVADKDIFKSYFVPKTCNHCYKSPCVQVCPVGATFVSPDGVVLIDEKYCIACGYCVQACPYGCRFINPTKDVADKCSLCYHRLKKGLPPACVEVCPTGARIHGDLHDKKGELVKFIKEHNCHVLKPHLNTGSKLFYNALSSEVR